MASFERPVIPKRLPLNPFMNGQRPEAVSLGIRLGVESVDFGEALGPGRADNVPLPFLGKKLQSNGRFY